METLVLKNSYGWELREVNDYTKEMQEKMTEAYDIYEKNKEKFSSTQKFHDIEIDDICCSLDMCKSEVDFFRGRVDKQLQRIQDDLNWHIDQESRGGTNHGTLSWLHYHQEVLEIFNDYKEKYNKWVGDFDAMINEALSHSYLFK